MLNYELSKHTFKTPRNAPLGTSPRFPAQTRGMAGFGEPPPPTGKAKLDQSWDGCVPYSVEWCVWFVGAFREGVVRLALGCVANSEVMSSLRLRSRSKGRRRSPSRGKRPAHLTPDPAGGGSQPIRRPRKEPVGSVEGRDIPTLKLKRPTGGVFRIWRRLSPTGSHAAEACAFRFFRLGGNLRGPEGGEAAVPARRAGDAGGSMLDPKNGFAIKGPISPMT